MPTTQSQNRNEVKNVKFHHKVKRFYHKNLFRKIYTVAIVGLIGANVFSMVKYASFADELEGLEQTPVINQVTEDEEIIPDWLELGMDDSDLNEISTDISPIDDKEDGSTFSGEVVEDLSGSLDEVHLAAPETDKEEIKIQATQDNPSNLPADWQFGTITLVDQESPEYAITIMDRNLGATTNDITDKGSYGYYYQWGRNYGFPGADTCEGIDDPDWDGYCPLYGYVAESLSTQGLDDITDAERFENYDSDLYDWWEDGQGPCPEGWHVSTQSDFYNILGNYGNAANIGIVYYGCASIEFGCDANYYYDHLEAGDRFINYLRLPFAGYRSSVSNVNNVNYQGLYRTTNNYYGYNVTNEQTEVVNTYYMVANAMSVRCVSDNYEYTGDIYTVSFYDGDSDEPFKQYVAQNERAIRPEFTSENKLLIGWKTSDGKDYDFSKPVTSDLDLYADWIDTIVYEDGYIMITDGENTVYIKDKNQGATATLERLIQLENLQNEHYGCYGNPYLDSLSINTEGGDLTISDHDCRSRENIYSDATQLVGFPINSDYDLFSEDTYNKVAGTVYGNYYFRGNNVGATYDELGILQNGYDVNINEDAIARGFNGGKLGDDNTGWEEGSNNNPCDAEEGEYLPTVDDWGKAMEIWSETKGYDLNIYDYDDYGHIYYDSDFLNDILLSNAGYIYGRNFCQASLSTTSLINNINDMGYNGGIYLWTALDNYVGYLDNSEMRYYKYGLGNFNFNCGGIDEFNTYAMPVRCFIDPDYINGVEKYTVTFDTKGGNETIASQIIKEGKKVKEPSTPTRDRYTFDGWYTSNGTKWNFSTDTVQGEMTLSAKRRLCGEGFVVEDNKCIPEGMELNGVIKVTSELGTMYIRDRNAGGVSDAAVKWLKFMNLSNSIDFDVCDETCAIKEFNNAFGTIYTRMEEIMRYIDELRFDVLEGLFTEEEMEGVRLQMKFDNIRNEVCSWDNKECIEENIIDYMNETYDNEKFEDIGEVWEYLYGKYGDRSKNIDAFRMYLVKYYYDNQCGNEARSQGDWDEEVYNACLLEYYNEEYPGEDFDDINDARNYIDSNYKPDYLDDLINAQAYGNYYYRGNNSGVNYNDLEIDYNVGRITNMDALIARGFNGGNIGNSAGNGWIEGNEQDNPCDASKGEYLPAPEDWKNLMEIWGNANDYEFSEDGDNYYHFDMDDDIWRNKLLSDLLFSPEAGSIYEETCGDNELCGSFGGWSPLWTSQDDEGNLGVYNRDDMGFWGELYYAHFDDRFDEGWLNTIATPVRCFVNPAEIPDVYVVSYETNGGNTINDVNVIAGDTVILPTPTRANYTFAGWYTDKALTQTFNSSMHVTSDITLYAKWTQGQTSTPASSYSGGGRKATPVTNIHNSADEKNSIQNETKGTVKDGSSLSREDTALAEKGSLDMKQYNATYTPEQNTAYQFAKSHGITTTSSIREAKMNTPLTRIEMAKMLSYYAVNVLGMIPSHGAGVARFSDVPADLDEKYDNGVALAYQLGIMGINMPNNEFRPYDKVTRAEFATALSRMIYGMEDGTGRVRYYEPHIARLYNEGIINVTNPKMQELRGNVMTMLMRTVE